MKTFKLFYIFIIIGLLISCSEGKENSNSTGSSSTGKVITSNQRGTSGGYDYEFWSNGNATGKMTLGEGGAFNCEWTNKGNGGNILFRSGKRYNSSQSHSKLGRFTINYSATYNPGSSGASYLSVYGWTRNPLVEYYIVENYAGGYHPGSSGVRKGSFTIAGEGTYDVYTRDMKNQPAIEGSGTYNFTQYISVRTQKRLSGTISVTRHFEEWAKLGLNMSGGFYEVMMKVEGYNNSGSAEIIENVLTIN